MDKSERKRLYKSNAWQVTRHKALERAGYECEDCKDEGKLTINQNNPDKHKLLDVDHIEPLETHPELAFDLDNLRVRCVRHHNIKEGRFVPGQRKVNKWSNDEWW